jgi:hypothetical protein
MRTALILRALAGAVPVLALLAASILRPAEAAGTTQTQASKGGVTGPGPAPPPGIKRVVLYGDSLAQEAQIPFRNALAAAGINQVVTRTFGGTAICDWLPQMRADQARLHPDAVVIEFSGNALTPCMKDSAGRPLSGAAYFDKYGDDARTVLKIFAPNSPLVYFAGSPVNRQADKTHDPDAGRLNHLYATISSGQRNAQYIAADLAVTDHGHWTETLPCLPEEPCTGGSDPEGNRVNIVRAPDGAHFCPGGAPAVRGVTDTCPVWSSGANRYGTAIAAPVINDLTGHHLESQGVSPGGSPGANRGPAASS